MKLLIFQKKKSNLPIRREVKISPFAQTSGSDIFIKCINKRRRGISGPNVFLRKHRGIYKKVLLFVLLIGIFGFVAYKINLMNYFNVSSIDIVGASHFVNEKDLRILAERDVLGQSIFLINSQNLSKVLSRNFLGAKAMEVEKKYPSKIRIVVEERIPIAVIYNDKDEYFLIDSEGYVLGVVDKDYPGLARIKYEGDIKIGGFLEKGMIPVSIEILQYADKENLKISSMSFYEKYSKIYIDNGIEVYLGYDKNVQESLKTVGALIKKMIVESKIIKKIDLRYDKVIVLYD